MTQAEQPAGVAIHTVGESLSTTVSLRSVPDVLGFADAARVAAFAKLDEAHRTAFGQFGTPPKVARLMASMFNANRREIRLLDAGAGVGSLSAAFVAELLTREVLPTSIAVTAYEVEPMLAECLRDTLSRCHDACATQGVSFSSEVILGDFIETSVRSARGDLFAVEGQRFNCAIQNPPYRKINSDSTHRRLLRQVGIETTNLYSAFLSLTLRVLEPGGELVAITPRSFCNGPYFKAFRREFLSKMALRHIHVFDTRDTAFSQDSVLQENVIVHSVRGQGPGPTIEVSSSAGSEDDVATSRTVAYGKIVPLGDAPFIHIVSDGASEQVTERMERFSASLWDLDADVCTGRVVDFRSREFLRLEPENGAAPLLYPCHFNQGFIKWPVAGKKANALAVASATKEMLHSPGWYVLVKRFSSKEEPRRVVAAVVTPEHVGNVPFAVENHLNVFHRRNAGLPPDLAKGLAAFLNSTLLDLHFRQFSGHTQVNATDLRGLKYPTQAQLIALGAKIGDTFPTQAELDTLVEKELGNMGKRGKKKGLDPVKAKRRVEQAQKVLEQLGLPKAQVNERSALTLLALLDLKADTPWSKASAPMLGITPIMDYMAEHYGKTYAPNSRETVRRQTVHQFLDAALVVQNPDDPKRPTNSGNNVYQIEPSALELLRKCGGKDWDSCLADHLKRGGALKEKYAQARTMERIPITLSTGEQFTLSAGGQNPLVAKLIEEFCPRYTPGAKVIYVGDTDEKWAHFDRDYLKRLGVEIEEHGKMPDVVIHHVDENWLLLIEAVTSHGPINPMRHEALKKLFAGSKAGLVFVTAFPDRKTYAKYLPDISWQTEVWIADDPTHMIHHDGKRFLGPYDAP